MRAAKSRIKIFVHRRYVAHTHAVILHSPTARIALTSKGFARFAGAGVANDIALAPATLEDLAMTSPNVAVRSVRILT